jgi:hypothetical protein
MRIDEVIDSNKKLSRNVRLNTEEGRQMALLSVLTDISETLALFLDMYAMTYGRVLSTKKDESDANTQ